VNSELGNDHLSNKVAWWHYTGLAIHRLQVRVLAGHHHVVALGKPLTLVCLCHQAV